MSEKKTISLFNSLLLSFSSRYDEVIALCQLVTPLLLADASLVEMSSPCFVFGDLHGNYRDLINFQKASFPLGISLGHERAAGGVFIALLLIGVVWASIGHFVIRPRLPR